MLADPPPVQAPQETYVLTRWLFLRLLGLVYLLAFVSFGTQILGLIGSQGILPVADLLAPIREYYGAESFVRFPTWVWLNSSDGFLQILCAGGMLTALLLILNIAPVLMLALSWSLYLSLVTAGQIFMGYQWDALLLETGFIAIFFAPLTLWPRRPHTEAPRPILWVLRWLLLRLMLSSGLVKLLSGDPTWANLTALAYHYETQPLPAPLAWYAHQLPLWIQQISTLTVLVVELAVPLFIILPWRRLRLLAGGLLVLLQLLIALTGNYTFFNLLAAILCLTLLDDRALRPLLSARWVGQPVPDEPQSIPRRRLWGIRIFAGVLFSLGLLRLLLLVFPLDRMPPPLPQLVNTLAPFRMANSYGLFAVMTTTRPEIIIEGSTDGQTWLAYELPYKPGAITRAPQWIAPYQPRLDWQLWFAALGRYEQNPWLANFMLRLLEGSPEVLALLADDPFAETPPRYIRAMLYDYRFTESLTAGAWWQRTLTGMYSPVISLEP